MVHLTQEFCLFFQEDNHEKKLLSHWLYWAPAQVLHTPRTATSRSYGTVDTGLIKETGSDVRMGSNEDSRIGFKGTEELGSGMKATFQLERRFSLNNGTKFSGNNALDILGKKDGS